MATPINSRPRNQNYLGNRSTHEVHSLRAERGQCQIDEIVRNGNAVSFTPDNLVRAQIEGYDNCAWCIGGSLR